jgi:hypothetical protein
VQLWKKENVVCSTYMNEAPPPHPGSVRRRKEKKETH